jgi:DNA-binding NarL/FixJ family response regulator
MTADGEEAVGLAGRTVLLVDDHDVMRAGLAMLLLEIVGMHTVEARGPVEATAAMQAGSIDLVLMDVRLGPTSGIDLLRDFRTQWPSIPVLMLSTFDGPEDVEPAIDAGAAGYVLKDATPPQLQDAMTSALTGDGLWLSPSVAARVYQRQSRTTKGPGSDLTDREREILGLLTKGATNDEIAAELVISAKTVKTHLSTLFRKLGVSNRTQAVSAALRERIIDPGS